MTDDDRPATIDASRREPRPLRVGVVGVGNMGENHARVYSELRGADLVGISDLDEEQAARVAEAYGAEVLAFEALLDRADAVTVAVPTAAHYETVSTCLEADVDVLVEKPITADPDRGRELARLADERDRTLQVGHIERFNPAVETVADLIDELEVIAVSADRLGPPIDRTATDGVVPDLMIHDIDVVRSLLGGEPESVAATTTADGQHATATLEFDDVVARLTASRVTQKKVRRLCVTARECRVEVDYLDQTVTIHRKSYPEFVTDDGTSTYRHEAIVERPRVENREPLKEELASFLAAVRADSAPAVPAEDGLAALETVRTIERRAADDDGTDAGRDVEDVEVQTG